MADKIFEKYYGRIAKEGVLKAFLIALCFGAGALGVMALCSWIFGFKAGLWIGVALFAVLTGGLTPLLYFRKFRPTTKQIARRVDELGLEERVLTMTELENDSSYIAMRQREDAMDSLHHVDHMLLKIAVSTSLVVAVCLVGFAGLAFTTVDALYVADVIPSVLTSISETIGVKWYFVSYGAELSDNAVKMFEDASLPVPESGFGAVYYYDEENWNAMEPFGEEIEVKGGEQAPGVIAIAEPGYVFLQWSDGSRDPFRKDVVQSDLILTAFFEPLPDLDVDDPELQDPSSQNQQSDQGNGPNDGDGGGEKGDGQEGPGGDSAGGGPNSASGKILDGETYYGDDFSNAYEEAQERLNSDEDLSEKKKDWVNGYYESIERSD